MTPENAQNNAPDRSVRDDIRQYLEELKQSGTPADPALVSRLQQWHDRIRDEEDSESSPVFQLRERMKEISCLYAVIDALQTSRPDLKYEEALRKVLLVVPEGLRHPERCGVGLRLREKWYTTSGFAASERNMVAACNARDGVPIELHVSQHTGSADATGPLFLKEEQQLMEKIVRLVRRFYHHQLNVSNLADREEQFRTTIYSIGDGVITTDRNGKVDKMNPVAEEMTGWTETEARGNPIDRIFRIINEDTRQPVENPVQKVLKHGATVGLANHTLLLSRDGREIPITDSGAPIKNESGATNGVVMVFQDQTEERDIRRKMDESEKKFRAIVEHAPGPIAIITERRYAYVNPAALALYGAEGHGELTGSPVTDRIHPNFHDVIDERIRLLMDEGGKNRTEPSKQIHLKLDGSQVWVEVVCSPIIYGGSKSILIFLRDITRNVEYEKMIRQNLKEKEVMLAEIHHRVKNNLAVISGLLELEAGHADSPELVNVLRKAENRVRSMALIHEKLYQSNSLADVDFASYITELAEFVKNHFRKRNQDVEFRFDLEPVALDVTRAVPCGIIINEILTNGLKYAFNGVGGGNITLTLSEHDGEVLLGYRDDGTGMPGQMLDQIRNGQTGTLGMELVTALTRQLKGEIDFRNEGGTRIDLRFRKETV